jgi:hypothetical protein
MIENPLKSEETFQKFVNGLCCNGCKFFVSEKCCEENHEAHDADKAWTIQASLNDYLKTKRESDREFVENINNYYVCLAFESRNG